MDDFPLALGGQDHGPLVPVGPHLLLHRVLDGQRRVDGLELDSGHPDPPLAGGLVQHPAQLPVDGVPAGQRLFQIHPADHIPQRRRGQLLDRDDVVGDLVDGRPRVGHLEVDDGVDRYGQVVLGDHRLRWEGDDLLAQVDPGPDTVQERRQPHEAGAVGLVEPAEPFDDGGLCLWDDLHRSDDHDDHQHDDDQSDDQNRIHEGPSISCLGDRGCSCGNAVRCQGVRQRPVVMGPRSPPPTRRAPRPPSPGCQEATGGGRRRRGPTTLRRRS